MKVRHNSKFVFTIDPFLYAHPDAAVEGDEALAAFALAALAKVAARGGEPVASTLDTSNVLPLLQKLGTGVLWVCAC